MFRLHNYLPHLGHMVPKSLTNPRLHSAGGKRLTLKLPIETALLQEENLLTSILHTPDKHNQYNMTYFVAHVTHYSYCLSDSIMSNMKHHSAYKMVCNSLVFMGRKYTA